VTKGAVRPIKLQPRLDAKPWGGRQLAEWGISLPPDEAIGEALLTAPEATVASGPLLGTPLSALASGDPGAWIGARGLEATGGRTIFPLLVKLIDGQADLSIQIHPDDRAAAAAGLGTGKTEAYHVLAAEPGSVIYLGIEPEVTPEAFTASCLRANGSAAGCLRQIPAEPGMTVLIPAGTPHALGAGIVLYEIQQPSNVTFRLDDWGRVDAAGLARALHHREGLALVDPLSRPEPIPRVPLVDAAADRSLLVATPYFALERIAVAADGAVHLDPVASPQVLTPVTGAVMLDASGWVASAATGESVVLPAGLGATLSARGDCVILRGWVPDLEREVIGPARAAGASDAALRRLGLTLADPVDIMRRPAPEPGARSGRNFCQPSPARDDNGANCAG
jgi:mannose-6-phosphate isomerase